MLDLVMFILRPEVPIGRPTRLQVGMSFALSGPETDVRFLKIFRHFGLRGEDLPEEVPRWPSE
jgi:hypothetical protein